MLKYRLYTNARKKLIEHIKPLSETPEELPISDMLGNEYLEYLVIFVHRIRPYYRYRRTLSFQSQRNDVGIQTKSLQGGTPNQNVNIAIMLIP